VASQIDQKVKEFREQTGQKEKAPLSKMLMAYSNKYDRIYLAIGLCGAAAGGVGLPLFVFFMGDVINSFRPNEKYLEPPYYDKDQMLHELSIIAFRFAMIAIAMLASGYIFFSFLLIFGERVGGKIRVRYFKAILQQEAAWFDASNTAELSARLSKES